MNKTHPTLSELVDRFEMLPHPEGGFYKEIYRAKTMVTPPGFEGERAASTAIYYALGPQDQSHFHRLKSDEIWHHYLGATALIHCIDEKGHYEIRRVGTDFAAGDLPQVIIPAGTYFAATVASDTAYVLVGCTVAPGFDFQDFEMPTQGQLLEKYPQHQSIIKALGRPNPTT